MPSPLSSMRSIILPIRPDVGHAMLEYWQQGGPILVPLAAVCFGIWLYTFRTRRMLGAIARQPAAFDRRLEQAAASGDAAFVRRWVQSLDGLLPWALAHALCPTERERNALDTFERCVESALLQVRRNLGVLSTLTRLAPLLGLLGTVTGMTETFHGMAAAAARSTEQVAGGIGEALVTTQMGLIVAIPGILAVAYFSHVANEVRLVVARTRGVLRRLVGIAPGACAGTQEVVPPYRMPDRL